MIKDSNQIDTICDFLVIIGMVTLVMALPLRGRAALKAWALLVPAAAWLLKMIYYKKPLFNKTPLDMPLVIAFIAILLSCTFSIRPPYSFREFQSEFLWHFTIFYLITSNIKTNQQLKLIFWSILVGYSWVAIYGIAGYFFGFGIHGDDLVQRRAKSIMGHPGEAAFFFSLIIPLAAGVAIFSKKLQEKIVLGIFVVVSFIFLILTFSRGGWIGTSIALVYILLKSRLKLLVIVIVVALAISPFLPETIFHRLTMKAIGDRIYLWKSAICMIADYPIFGVGYGNRNYQQLYPRYSFPGIQEGNLQNSHNFYLQILVEMGIIGGLIFLNLFKAIIYHSWKTMQREQEPFRKGLLLGGLGTMIAFLFFSITTWRYEDDTALLLWIIISMLMVIHNINIPANGSMNGICCCESGEAQVAEMVTSSSAEEMNG